MEAQEIIELIRASGQEAQRNAETADTADLADARLGWYARAKECRQLLEQIEGTPEELAVAAEARRRDIDY
jgi:hypothetical protein